MSTDEFLAKQQEKINAILKDNKPLIIAVKSVSAIQSKRIWILAKNKSGSNIGEYKNREYYINPKNSPKSFTTKGKKQTSRKSTHVTGYFENWLSYKKAIGQNKNTNSVNLSLFGELSRNWANGKVENPTPNRVNQHNYQIRLTDINAKKVERYGVDEVFGLSTSEKKIFLDTLNFELKNALK